MIAPAALLAAYTAALNRFDLSAVAEMFAADATYHSPGLPQPVQGRDAIMRAFAVYFADHSDQVNGDADVQVIEPLALEAGWWLVSNGKRRSGRQRIRFNAAGLISSVEVWDE